MQPFLEVHYSKTMFHIFYQAPSSLKPKISARHGHRCKVKISGGTRTSWKMRGFLVGRKKSRGLQQPVKISVSIRAKIFC